MNSLLRSKGFALPAVLISSVVMMSVLLVSLTSISSTAKSIELQYENKLLESTVDAGLEYANGCYRQDSNTANWTYLYPGSTCGNEYQCLIDSAATCWLYNEGGFRTTFEVSATSFDSSGKATIYVTAKGVRARTSSGEVGVVQTLVKKAKLQRVVVDGSSSKLSASFSSTYAHTCAIGIDKRIYCWGDNGSMQLGTSYYGSSYPIPVEPATAGNPTAVSVSAGVYHTCMVSTLGSARCWGYGAYGALGTGSYSNAPAYATVLQGAVPAGVKFTNISSGYYHTCAMGTDDKAYCWGDNGDGKLGNGQSGQHSNVPVAVSQGAVPSGVALKAVSARYVHTCALGSDGKVYCWGGNPHGQLGNGSTIGSATPVAVSQGQVPSGVTMSSIAVGAYATCGIGSNGKVYCWGYNGDGELGNGSTASSSVPVAVAQGAIPTDVTIENIAAGASSFCGVGSNGKAYCWGYNGDGQLGNGSTTNALAPVAVAQGAIPTDMTIKTIAAGIYHACALASNGMSYCWGRNNVYQHGHAGSPDTLVPSYVTVATKLFQTGVYEDKFYPY